MKIRKICEIGLFAAIITLCAWISIPAPVPFTLQTFAVYAAALILGGRSGLISVSVYIMMGAVGLPVFSGFRGGPSVLCGATGGYIIGFLLIPLIIWAFEKSRVRAGMLIACAVGLIACYAFGTAWFAILYTYGGKSITIGAVLSMCVVPFVLPDAVKIVLAWAISARLKK